MPRLSLSWSPTALLRKNVSEALLGDPFGPHPGLRRRQQFWDRSQPPCHRLSYPPWRLQTLGAQEIASFVEQSDRRDNLLRQLLIGDPQFSRCSDAFFEGRTRRAGRSDYPLLHPSQQGTNQPDNSGFLGKMPTTSLRRLISPLRRSSGLVCVSWCGAVPESPCRPGHQLRHGPSGRRA